MTFIENLHSFSCTFVILLFLGGKPRCLYVITVKIKKMVFITFSYW